MRFSIKTAEPGSNHTVSGQRSLSFVVQAANKAGNLLCLFKDKNAAFVWEIVALISIVSLDCSH